ncbi:MAG: ABC transporter ATP-binding protein [Desulfobacterales bacterium]|nr:ABC transporter ATP-binding protein [Desulfobacterales bacterium]
MAAMNSEALLRVENLKKHFPIREGFFTTLFSGGRKYVYAVNDVSFHLNKNEILGFVGESGCGKSTMSRTLLRLTEPTGGEVRFKGVNVSALPKKEFKPHRARMQMIFQDPFGSLNPRRTVADTIRQTIRIHRLAENREAENALIEKTLVEVGLEPVDQFWSKYPALMSGGQLQRVSIGRVLVLQPDFVIADESVSMLDVSVRIGILDLLLKMRDKFGISFIYITHDLVTARYICDRIAIMYLGRIVEIGPAEEIIHDPRHPYTRALISAVPAVDPTAKIPELPIKGYVPVTPDGALDCCAFHPRCPYGEAPCRETLPEMQKIAPDHRVACLKVNQIPD